MYNLICFFVKGLTLKLGNSTYTMKPISLFCSIIILFLGCNHPQETNTYEALNQEKLWTIDDRNFILAELDRTTDLLIEQTRDLTPEQAQYKLTTAYWTITEIIEHLEVQNELHFREIRAISKTPQLLKYVAIVKK